LLLNKIGKKQIYLVKKIKNYYKINNRKYKDSIKSISYFSTYSESPGFAVQKYWLYNLRALPKLIIIFLKDIYSILNYISYEIIDNVKNKNNKNKIIITWGERENFINGKFIDNYFNISSLSVKNSIWFINYTDKELPKFIPNNVIILKRIKKKNNFLYLISLLIKNIIKSKFNYKKFLNLSSGLVRYSENFNHCLKKYLTRKIKFVTMPYEAQPFQNQSIKLIKENLSKTKIVGYLHSYPSLPTHVIKNENSPHKLIINSMDQKFTLQKYLGWNLQDIEYKPSLRFLKNKKNSVMSGNIYLPYKINSVSKISFNLQILFTYLNKNITKFKIKNHRNSLKSKKNLLLINKIKQMKNQFKKVQTIKNASIFIGATGAIVEALERNIDVYHISEDPVFDFYNKLFWPNIKSKLIGKNIFKYSLKNKRKTILFGNNTKHASSYFKK